MKTLRPGESEKKNVKLLSTSYHLHLSLSLEITTEQNKHHIGPRKGTKPKIQNFATPLWQS